MGWTITDLGRARMTLEQAKQNHLDDATDYGDRANATLIAHEWHARTFYAIIRLEYPQATGKAPVTFLRTHMIEASPSSFGYKDMQESMGAYVDERPTAEMRALIYKHIPIAEGYAIDFRKRNGIKYKELTQPELFA